MKYLKGLSKNLELFYPELNNSFMCPICLKIISLSNKNKISEAHIIPKAAGGNVKTYLCTSCNNNFGSQQDKWFGEYVRLHKQKKHVLQTNIKKGHFSLDGTKINGEWRYGQDNKLELIIYGNRNSPEINDHILSKFQKEIPKSLRMEIPILEKERFIKIGYLTAAYLLCFATFGYSWVFQSYLAEIRNQIQNPDEKIIGEIFWSKADYIHTQLWLGIVTFGDKITLACGISGYLVMFPSYSNKNFYSDMEQFNSNQSEQTINNVSFRELIFTNKVFYDVPVSLIFDNFCLMLPDVEIKSKKEMMTIFCSAKGSELKFLFPISKNKFDEAALRPDAKIVKMKL